MKVLGNAKRLRVVLNASCRKKAECARNVRRAAGYAETNAFREE